MNLRNLLVILFFWSTQACSQTESPLLAFPEAEGFGAYATGGRGGEVIKVINLNGSGSGSLQWAVNQKGPRIIVFATSGVIQSDIHIPHGELTIAGQTAPGAGITIAGHLYSTYGEVTSNIVIRHIRVRPPNPDSEWPHIQHDGIRFSTSHTIILDHIDVSNAADENIDLWGGAHHITIQWSNISFPIYDPDWDWDTNRGVINHRPCLDDDSCDNDSLTGGYISIHHNLFAHNTSRTPALSIGPADVRNNLIYNGREGFVHHNVVDGEFNIVGNKYIAGPSVNMAPFWFDPENNSSPIPSRYWMYDNLIEDPKVFNGVVNNPYDDNVFNNAYYIQCCDIVESQFNQTSEFLFTRQKNIKPKTHKSTDIETIIINSVGAFPRDIVSRTIIQDLQLRKGRWDNYRPEDLMSGLKPIMPQLDQDNDGMPDSWELVNGLNPDNSEDHLTLMPSGYTAIEEYINNLAITLSQN